MARYKAAGTVIIVGGLALVGFLVLFNTLSVDSGTSTVLADKPLEPATLRSESISDVADPLLSRALDVGDDPEGDGDAPLRVRGQAAPAQSVLDGQEAPVDASPTTGTSTPATEPGDDTPDNDTPDNDTPDNDTEQAEAKATEGKQDGTDQGEPASSGSGSGDATGSINRATPVVDGPAIYVDPVNGSDGGQGTSEETAFGTFQQALDAVEAGQTIYLMSGDYSQLQEPGQHHYYLGESGRPDAWIRITAAPGHNPTIVATNGTALFLDASYVEVSNLTIRGSGFNAERSWGVGISVPNTHHIRISGNRISGMPAGGVSIVGSSNFQVLNNTVYENAFWSDVAGSGISVFEPKNHGHGPDVGKYHNLITGNRLYRNENKVPSKWQDYRAITDGNGIIIDSAVDSGYTDWTLVANNLTVDNGSRGILVWRSSHVDIVHNTAYHNARRTDMNGRIDIAAGRSHNIRLENNVSWARPGVRAADFDENESTITSVNNIFITDNADSNSAAGDTVLTPGAAAGLLRNPSVTIGDSDFRPVAGGLLVGAGSGDRSGPLSTDLAGTARGEEAEPGAFEVDASHGR